MEYVGNMIGFVTGSLDLAALAVPKPTSGGKPLQLHHFATNKNTKYTPQFESIVSNYGLKLDDVWNKEYMPHQGRHPNAYHDFVLENMKQFDSVANGDKDIFLSLFEQLKADIRANPEWLYKAYWEAQK